jgi:hypothetical protein
MASASAAREDGFGPAGRWCWVALRLHYGTHVHLGDESIAPAGNGRDVAMLTGPLAEGAAQRMNGLGKASLLDDDMRPQRLDEGLLLDELPRPFHQVDERFEHASGDLHLLAVSTRHEHPPQGIELEVGKFVDQVSLRIHAVL